VLNIDFRGKEQSVRKAPVFFSVDYFLQMRE
jgi:hypothetical protein